MYSLALFFKDNKTPLKITLILFRFIFLSNNTTSFCTYMHLLKYNYQNTCSLNPFFLTCAELYSEQYHMTKELSKIIIVLSHSISVKVGKSYWNKLNQSQLGYLYIRFTMGFFHSISCALKCTKQISEIVQIDLYLKNGERHNYNY